MRWQSITLCVICFSGSSVAFLPDADSLRVLFWRRKPSSRPVRGGAKENVAALRDELSAAPNN
jgi:hypothetical protein